MADERTRKKPKILILATDACAYPGADHVGQIHAEYPANTYIVRIPAPVLFPEAFYLRCFERGFDAVLVMACGVECPYPGAYPRLAARIEKVHVAMKERGIDTRRLRICSICTVCSKAFLKEVRQMHDFLNEAGSAASASDVPA
jgi:coenzyme F420-reducing hydrogenase delta subunit